MEVSEQLQFEGCNFMRQRLLYSILSGRPVVISKIRPSDDDPGIKDFETKLLSLLEKVTNGTKIVINKTGTEIQFTPGMINGGSFTFDCGTQRCISFFLEPLLILAPFCKYPLNIKLQGVTNSPNELSVDAVRATWIPVFNRFVFSEENLEIKVEARGLKPDGGGSVLLSAPIVTSLRPVQFENPGKIYKIRGVAYVAKVSPSIAQRMIEAAKKCLYGYIADVYITVDQRKGAAGGKSPGYGLFLTAETTEGVVFHGEAISRPKNEEGNPLIPEEVGNMAGEALLDEIYRGGCLDSSAQLLAASFMTLGDKDISKCLFGPLTTYTIHGLRNLQKFLGITFKIEEWWKCRKSDSVTRNLGADEKALMTCMGIGFRNLNKIVL